MLLFTRKHIAKLLKAGFLCQSLATAFNANCNSNYASYYGQNSARNQKTLGEYCRDSTEDLIVLAFMNGFPNILLNFANACETTFPGSALLHCPTIAEDIKFCQSQGKAVILSMGGASGAYGFSSDADGAAFADTVWDMFFKGSSAQRPFDDAVLDGIDLDIEGGSPTGYASFIKKLRSHYSKDSDKQYYIAAAPQCPFPDAYLGSTLNTAWFDMVFVQFYNNYCGLNAYPGWFNFDEWDKWAKTNSVNKDVRVYIGAPGAPSAASTGYVDGQALAKIFKNVRSQYTSLGGIMTWDVSQSRTSGLANDIRAMLDNGGSCGNHTTTPPVPTYSSSTTSSTTDGYSTTPISTPSVSVVTSTRTVTKTVTSVSTFVSSHLSTVTVVSPYTSYMTVVVTYTESAPGSVSYNSTESGQPTSSWSGVYTTKTISKTRTTTATRSRTRSSTRTRTIKTSDSTYVESSTDDSTSDLQTLPQSTSATETTSTDLEPTESSASNSTIAFSNCPVEGAPCIESTQGCNSLGYALCINSKWAIYPCSVGTTCYLLGTVAACDWEGVHAVDSCMSQPIVRKSLELAKESQEQITNNNNDVFHPTSIYTSHGIASRVEYVPISTAQNKFTGLLKIQSLLHPIPSRWKIKFQIPDSQTIEYADSGTVTLNKTSVTISSNQTASSHKSMALSIELRGTYEGTYHVPNFSTLILSSL